MRSTTDAMTLFATVVQQGSFTAAARRLNLSKAAVSQQVKQLESRLDVQLLNRSTRTLSLTEAGRDYFQSCVRIQAEVLSAEERLRELKQEVSGTLKVTCTANFGVRHIVPAIIAFKKRYPKLHIEMLMTDQVQELVAENIDLAFRFGPLMESNLFAKQVLKCPYHLCASPEYLERYGTPERISDLSGHNWIIHRMSRNPNRLNVGHQGELIEVPIKGDIITDNSQARRDFILAGLGIARIAAVDVQQELANGTLIDLMPNYDFGTMSLHGVYSHKERMTRKLRLFLDFIEYWLMNNQSQKLDL